MFVNNQTGILDSVSNKEFKNIKSILVTWKSETDGCIKNNNWFRIHRLNLPSTNICKSVINTYVEMLFT